MRLVHACTVPSCTREGTVTVTDKGVVVGHYCEDCWAIIDLILEETSRMVKLGTPRDVAADWAAAAVHKVA